MASMQEELLWQENQFSIFTCTPDSCCKDMKIVIFSFNNPRKSDWYELLGSTFKVLDNYR